MPVSLDDLSFFDVPVDPFLSIKSVPWPKAENFVSTVYFNTEIPLKRLVGIVGAVSYRSPKLTAVTIRFHNRGMARAPSAQMFGSGMVVYMGATSEMNTLYYVHLTRVILSQLGLKNEPRNGLLFVQNMVWSGCFYRCLNIADFERNGDRTGIVYSSKSFPGIVYMTKPPYCSTTLSFSLFQSGRYNVMRLLPDELYTGFFPVMRVLQRNSSDTNTRAYSKRRIDAVKAACSSRTNEEDIIDVVVKACNGVVAELYDVPENIDESVLSVEPPPAQPSQQFVVTKVQNPEFHARFYTNTDNAVPLGAKRRRAL